ncbi:MAG TPA: hypothetical protein VG759_03230 [Candidatus Angelobacter sp.]|jgi:hypothetical protein|nr:hypothetical protein [Candidatus Angelobacter sp.]
MVQQFRLVILFVILLSLQIVNAQVSNDWRNRYGPPAAESYLLRDGIVMTAYYSAEGKTCKIEILPFKSKEPDGLEKMLQEIVPVNARGKEISSIGLTSSANGIASRIYERVSIASTDSQGRAGVMQSATVRWKGIQCLLPEKEQTRKP